MDDNKPFTSTEAHRYWRNPDDGMNTPQNYLLQRPDLQKRDQALLQIFDRHVSKDATILEIGCNAGRNLRSLLRAGYRNLSAIEISQKAVDVMRELEPEVYAACNIVVDEAEAVLARAVDGAYDVIFSTAVLVHIATDAEGLFADMVRCARRKVIVIEFEGTIDHSRRHFPREYRSVFESLGMRQLEEVHPVSGFPRSYKGRVFSH